MENHNNSERRSWTPKIVRTMGGSAPTQYKAQRDSGERKNDAKTREPTELASEDTSSNKEQLRAWVDLD